MIRAEFGRPSRADLAQVRQQARTVHSRAALDTVDQLSVRGKANIRSAFAGAGLGRLGNAIDATSDKRKGRIKSYGDGSFAVSAAFFIRSRSERSIGAIEAYTQGVTITARRGLMWFPSDEIQRMVGSGKNRKRLTPALWRERGLDTKIGPLIRIKSASGTPLMIVQNVGMKQAGGAGVRSLTKSGRPRKGDYLRQAVIAFVGIPSTVRASRVNITAILETVRAELPALYAANLRNAGGER